MMNLDHSKKALVVLSGGQDSTTCLFWALKYFEEIHAITFNYGQRHEREIKAARDVIQIASRYAPGIIKTHEILALHASSHSFAAQTKFLDMHTDMNAKILEGTSPLVSDNALDQYEDFNSLPGGLEKTFVPMRNQFFLTLAANRAFCLGISNLITGVCQEDYGGYPDCRQNFIDALQKTCNLGTFTEEAGFQSGLCIHTPLMNLTKAESIELAIELPGCYGALAHSHTAYDGLYPPTGSDHATLLRAKGFFEAGVPDPLVLRAVKEGLMIMPIEQNYAPEAVEKAWEFIENV